MQRRNFVFNIEAEHSDSVLIKILTAIIRRRMLLISFSSEIKQDDDRLYIMFIIEETGENAEKFAKQLDKQVDILSVRFSEQKMTNDKIKIILPSTAYSSVSEELLVEPALLPR